MILSFCILKGFFMFSARNRETEWWGESFNSSTGSSTIQLGSVSSTFPFSALWNWWKVPLPSLWPPPFTISYARFPIANPTAKPSKLPRVRRISSTWTRWIDLFQKLLTRETRLLKNSKNLKLTSVCFYNSFLSKNNNWKIILRVKILFQNNLNILYYRKYLREKVYLLYFSNVN